MAVAEHPFAPEDVQAYADGELAPDAVTVVEAHLADCPACSAIVERVRGVSAAMAQWHVETPPLALVAPAAGSVARRTWRTTRVWQSAAVLVLGTGLFWAGNRSAFWNLNGEKAESLEAAPGVPVMHAPGGPRRETRQLIEAESPNEQTPADLAYARRAAESSPPSESPRPLFTQGQGQQGPAGRQSQLLRDRQAPADSAAVPVGQRSPMVIRTATLELIARDFDSVRSDLDRIVEQSGGFTGHIDLSTASGQARWLKATLRVPSDRLAGSLDSIRGLGAVVSESQGGDDVTSQAVDLDARLANARETEKRLVQVLQTRTGRVGDVLQVEREIARVREEIERMSAERIGLRDRVSYATIILEIQEERRAALNLGPTPVSGRLRNALVEGITRASESALGSVAFAMRVGPTLTLWALILAWPVVVVWRRLQRPEA